MTGVPKCLVTLDTVTGEQLKHIVLVYCEPHRQSTVAAVTVICIARSLEKEDK